MNILDRIINQFFKPIKPLPAGTYTSNSLPDSEHHFRLHLRIEPDGNGILILNARTVLHLNQTAVEHLYHQMQGTPQTDAVQQISRRYRVAPAQVHADYLDIQKRIEELIYTPDLDPETYLEFERVVPYSKGLSAPYRLDCALTYQSSSQTPEHVAPSERVDRELLFSEWQTILEKSWKAGIPHVIFTGGEPTIRPDLPDLIAYAEQLGQVTGLLTDGLRLTNNAYLHQVLLNGLDHLMLVLSPSDEQSWEAVRDCMAEDIFTTVHLTLTENQPNTFIPLIQRLKGMGVSSVSLSVADPSWSELLTQVQQVLADNQMDLVWDLPVAYSRFHPVALEAFENQNYIDGSGRAWLYVEPDGDVLPGQGIQQKLGNLLHDNWEQVWQAAKEAGESHEHV